MNFINEIAVIPLLFPDWLDPAYIIQSLGNWALWGVALIVFLECAIWPILPGDSLLFTVGMFIAMTPPSITFAGLDKPAVLAVSTLILTVAAVLGNVAGFYVGKFISPWLFKPRPGLIGKAFSQKHLDQTHAFFEKYGAKALVLGRFVPFVRTFVTMVAGAAGMSFRHFITWTALGGVIWAAGVTVLGYLLGNVPFIGNNIDLVLVLIVGVSVLPMLVEYVNNKRKSGIKA